MLLKTVFAALLVSIPCGQGMGVGSRVKRQLDISSFPGFGGVNMPNIDTSNIHLPNIDTSNFHVPNIDTSNIHLPNIDTSNFHVPNIDTSNIHMPNLPNIDTSNLDQLIPTNVNGVDIGTPNLKDLVDNFKTGNALNEPGNGNYGPGNGETGNGETGNGETGNGASYGAVASLCVILTSLVLQKTMSE